VIGLFVPGSGPGSERSDDRGSEPESAPVRRASQAAAPGELADLLHHWRLATVAERTADEYALLITELLRLVGLEITGTPAGNVVGGMVVSSSVPEVTSAIREMAHIWFDVALVVVEPGIRTGM